ncbi:SDR family oxidoreductase [Paenibacillus montanisoli]|uniref:Oxidoreductase n=1 Tax=Paenibacillus montanisoli TaxID=2081970 RepID=A0A328TYY8_9BACL|nr:SDR family oxidoreductase [Paenibacillus montanisoli]RAP75709.1 oxidoreductase [Paenibacillus montanisoli]
MIHGRKLENRIALVTGASRLNGIGAAICRSLAAEGADIFFTYWKKYDKSMPWSVQDQEPDMLRNDLLNLGVKCEKLELDLSDISAPSMLLDKVEEMIGAPSIVVNNATYSTESNYENLDARTLDLHYQINIRGTALLSSEFARRFNMHRGGRIINLTSGQSRGPMAGEIAYAATKGAIDAFTVTLSAEVASKGITVNAVNPGPTDTGWMNEEIKSHLITKFPMGRIGLPSDAARLIAFLASDDAEWITGQVIHSEGGFMR